MSDLNPEQDITFACDMNALSPEQRNHHITISPQLFRDVQEVRETTNGYAFRLPSESDTLFRCADFISHERLCCPFFAFNLEVEPQSGPVWLHITGTTGIKLFVIAEIGSYLNDKVAVAAGFR